MKLNVYGLYSRAIQDHNTHHDAFDELRTILAGWATLPAVIKVGIMAMVGATTP